MSVSDKETHTRERIRQLRKRAEDLGLRDDEIKALFHLDPTQQYRNYKTFARVLKTKILFRKFQKQWTMSCKSYLSRKVVVCAFVMFIAGYLFSESFHWDVKSFVVETMEEKCIVSLPNYVSEIVRPQVPCGMCRSLNRFPVVYNISREEFTTSYAYTGVPVLVKGATADWGALQTFDFWYFKDLYQNSSESLSYVETECHFFPYQTEFEYLSQVFEMSDDRAALKNGTRPWYIGWSSCDSSSTEVGATLRTQYHRPYFLPRHASNMEHDWIFMGGPGFGSGMHIDFVERPSWQAQVSGSKRWMLDPSPECWGQCQRLEVTVEKGDIIVVDTNIWYHSTRVNPGNISITIGAEYD